MNSRSSKKIDFLQYSNIFIPINIENKHWVLAVVTPVNKTLTMYDPLIIKHAIVELVLESYFNNRYPGTWTTTYNVSVPKQENAYDCGVFMVAFMWNEA
jgi:Ulp1 family protease